MTKELIVRQIQEGDNKRLAEIIRESLTEFGANKPGTVFYDESTDCLSGVFKTPGSIYYTAVVDGCVVGGAGIFPSAGLPKGICELVKMYLHKSVRGKGYSTTLLKHCFEFARNTGYKKIYIETLPELRKAVGIYEKFGFLYLDGPLGNTGHFGCDIWMLKEL